MYGASFLMGARARVPWASLIFGLATVMALGAYATRAQGAEQQPVAAAYRGTAAVAVRTVAAAEGRMAPSLSYTGDLKAGSQVSVFPKVAGRIESLSVELGSPVKKGQVLAELEAASLKAQVSQARANLEASEAKQASLLAGPRSEQVAQAKANLEAAQAKLSAMRQGGREEQVAQAQAAVDAARARAATVKKGATEADLRSAQSAVDAARANVQTATARLETVKQGPTQAEWGAALGAVDAARANLAGAQARLAEVKAGPKQAEILAAESAAKQAMAAVYAADDRRDIATSSAPEQTKYAAGVTTAAQADRAAVAAYAAYQAAEEKLNLLKSMPLATDVAAARSAVDAAKAAVMAAEYRVDQMKRGATPQEVQQADGAVKGAEAAVVTAEARLKQAKEGPTEEDVAIVEASVAQAEQALVLAQNPFRDEDLAQVRAAVTVADQQYRLVQDPYTDQDKAMVGAAVKQARAAVEMAEIALGESLVTSPVDGVVAEKFQSVGSLAGPGAPILTVIAGSMEMVLGVEEGQIAQVREGQKAEISVAAYPGEVFPAKVGLVGPVADPKTRTFPVKVQPESDGGKLRQGMSAQVRIVTQEKERVVLIPREAVVTRDGRTSVFVLSGEGAQQRLVTLGMRHDGTVEVADGLAAGEEVVVAGQTDLRDGDAVKKA